MQDLFRYAAELENAEKRDLPPVHKWNPEFCGDINLVIKKDGVWFYEGTPIGRARLVRLFSTVLRRDGDDYYLVTPYEKLRITVEDAPFIAVLMNTAGVGREQSLIFTTNVGDTVAAGADHALEIRQSVDNLDTAPYLHVRAGLEARVARSVFYELVELGVRRPTEAGEIFGVWSGGEFFSFGPSEEIFKA